MTQNFDDRHRQAALKATQILFKQALGMIPVVGPALSLGAEIVISVRDEFRPNEPMAARQILDLILTLPREDRERIADAEILVRGWDDKVSHLEPSEILKLRRNLVSLPDYLLHQMDLVRIEEAEVAEAKKREEEYTRQKEVGALQQRLRNSMAVRDWNAANKAAVGLISLGVRDREVIQSEQFSFKRMGLRPALLIYMLICGVISFFSTLLLFLSGFYITAVAVFIGSQLGIGLGISYVVTFRVRAFIQAVTLFGSIFGCPLLLVIVLAYLPS